MAAMLSGLNSSFLVDRVSVAIGPGSGSALAGSGSAIAGTALDRAGFGGDPMDLVERTADRHLCARSERFDTECQATIDAAVCDREC